MASKQSARRANLNIFLLAKIVYFLVVDLAKSGLNLLWNLLNDNFVSRELGRLINLLVGFLIKGTLDLLVFNQTLNAGLAYSVSALGKYSRNMKFLVEFCWAIIALEERTHYIIIMGWVWGQFLDHWNFAQFLRDVSQFVFLFVLQIGIPSTLTTIFLSRNGDSLSLSVFGLTNTILTMLFLIIIKGIGETTSLKLIHAKNIGELFQCKLIILRGGFCSLGLFIAFGIICILARFWMNWLRLDQILIDSCYPFLLWSLPYTFCQGMTQYLLEFMGSIWEVPETKLYNSVSLGISTLGPVIFI